jgi:hypothetical protein
MKSSVTVMKLAEILRCLHQKLWLSATFPGCKGSKAWVMIVASCNTLRNRKLNFPYTRTSKNPVLLWVYYSFNGIVSFVLIAKRVYNFLKGPTNSHGFMRVILLQSNHWHISGTHVAIMRVMRTRIQIQLFNF